MIDENKFWELIRSWEYQTLHESSATRILCNASLNEVIQMGPEVIPLVLKALPENWFLAFALHKITGEWPVRDEYAGNGEKIIESWRKWANKRGYK